MAPAPAWVDDLVLWHLYPLGFLGAEARAADRPAVAHRLGGLVPWLDYAADLGATGILLGPIFESLTHGYDTTDHFRIDPRLGDDGDFDALVAAARARGIRILLDGVFNHVGRAFAPFRRVLEQGPGTPEGAWFRLDWPPGAGPGTEPGYDTFEGHRILVALNHGAPAVADHVVRAMTHWLDRGAAGWRLDAAYAVPPAFWAAVLPRVRAAHPDAYVFGEVIHGDYPGQVTAGGLDSVTQYELWKAVWSSLNDGNLFELSWALDRHNGFLDTFVPVTFLGNHDVTRLASRLADSRHLGHALAVLFTLGGTPTVYAGDERGLRGIKTDGPGGDDAVRPAFPAAPEALAGEGAAVFRLHQDLIGLRRRHRWLRRARTRVLHLENRALAYESRGAGGALTVALNLAGSAVALPAPGAAGVSAGAGRVSAAGGARARVALDPHGWAVLES